MLKYHQTKRFCRTEKINIFSFNHFSSRQGKESIKYCAHCGKAPGTHKRELTPLLFIKIRRLFLIFRRCLL